jgi:hypothetical protein
MRDWECGSLRIAGFLLALLMALGAAKQAACAEKDVIVLKDGREVAGRIVREDENAVFLKEENGEERGIARHRIARILRAGQPREGSPVTAVAPTPAPADTGTGLPDPKERERAEIRELLEQLRDLGHPQREKRAAAMERARALGFRAVPVLLGILHPREKMPAELRLGSLRALAELGPLDVQGAQAIAWVAMKDPDPEVRREACRTIRRLKDDRATEYLLRLAISEDRSAQILAAQALREINDDRAFATLAAAIPPPQVTAAMPNQQPSAVEKLELPVGPMGTTIPIYLPTQEVIGGATNITSPPAEALKIIAAKNLGGLTAVWINWLREKCGLYTARDRQDERDSRSVRDRTGTPLTR